VTALDDSGRYPMQEMPPLTVAFVKRFLADESWVASFPPQRRTFATAGRASQPPATRHANRSVEAYAKESAMKHLAWMIVLGMASLTGSASGKERVTTRPATPTTGQTTTTSADVEATPPPPPTVRELPSTETKSPVNRALLASGTLLLGGTYATSAIVAFSSSRPEDQKYLYIPVAGPWMNLEKRDTAARPSVNERANKALLALDGIGQGLGALMMISSLFIPERTTRHWYLIGNEDVHGGPIAVGTGYGLGAAGRF
jgi:hypothetical protein